MRENEERIARNSAILTAASSLASQKHIPIHSTPQPGEEPRQPYTSAHLPSSAPSAHEGQQTWA